MDNTMTEIFKHKNLQNILQLPLDGSNHIKTLNMAWSDSGAAGFSIKALFENNTAGLRTWLMKVEAGAFSEMHAHDEIEQIYVLQGSFYDQNNNYGPGDFIVRAPGALHTAGSNDGALVMLVYSPAVDQS